MVEHFPICTQAILGLVDNYLLWKDKNDNPRGYEIYHPSAFGKCLRLMQYQRYSERGYIPTPEDPHAPSVCRIFGNGHSMHERWSQYFEEMGVLRGYWTCTNPLCYACDDSGEYKTDLSMKDVIANPHDFKRRIYGTDCLQGCFKPDKCVCGCRKFKYSEVNLISEELNFHGHADIILDFNNPKFDPDKYMRAAKGKLSWSLKDLPKNLIVVDMKSINHFGFQEVAKGNPDKHYLVQLTVYANILDCEYGVLIYENKNNQKTAAFKVPRSEDAWWPLIQRQALLMNEMTEVIDEDGEVQHLLPPPRYSCREAEGCNYCNYKDICHTSSIWDLEDFEERRQEFYGELL